MSVNRVILIGNVGQEPEVRNTASGAAVAKFSVATNERWKDKSGELQERTEWHNIECWNKLAEVVQKYVTKGMQVYVEGSIHSETYDDAQGNRKYFTKVKAQSIQFLGKRGAEKEPGDDDEMGF